jgi:hypothetical protein
MDVYPFDALPPATERWLLDAVTIGGGLPASGPAALARTDGGGLWTCWMNDIALETRAQIKAARALEAILDAGATNIIVPAFEWAFSPELVTHSDSSPFSDGSWYSSSPVEAELTAIAALRATVLSASFAGGVPLEAGERFSIVHPTRNKRLYTVARVLEADGDDYSIEIRPPLREAVTASTELDFSNPGCVMRLANPKEFLGAIDATLSSTANAVWVEAF